MSLCIHTESLRRPTKKPRPKHQLIIPTTPGRDAPAKQYAKTATVRARVTCSSTSSETSVLPMTPMNIRGYTSNASGGPISARGRAIVRLTVSSRPALNLQCILHDQPDTCGEKAVDPKPDLARQCKPRLSTLALARSDADHETYTCIWPTVDQSPDDERSHSHSRDREPDRLFLIIEAVLEDPGPAVYSSRGHSDVKEVDDDVGNVKDTSWWISPWSSCVRGRVEDAYLWRVGL